MAIGTNVCMKPMTELSSKQKELRTQKNNMKKEITCYKYKKSRPLLEQM